MTKRAKNSPIGEVECPHKGCSQTCKVYRFRPRTEGRTSVFSGKYYAECPNHGRIGSDGNPATSRYIQENHKPCEPKAAAPEKPAKNPAPPRSAPVPARKSAPALPSRKADSTPPAPASHPWWRPLIG